MTDTEFHELLMSEYAYWRHCGDQPENDRGISLGAMGAISNVMAATKGNPATWHPRLKVKTRIRRLIGWMAEFLLSFALFWGTVAFCVHRNGDPSSIDRVIGIGAAGWVLALNTNLRRRKVL